jgi:CubicO group peptidase (beta-lactamase class C family)
MIRTLSRCAAAALITALAAAPADRPHDLTEAKPEAVGFSSERLERLHALLEKKVEDKELPGMVTLLARHGKIVDYRTYGKKDLASGAPMDKEAIFRIYSMTKPVTGVAMMILYEQGKWSAGDPIAKYIPEFANLKVYKGDNNGQPVTEAPQHPPTMAELMSHNAGFTYGLFGNTAVDKLYMSSGIWASPSLQEFAGKLSHIPLLYQPGTKWVYSVSVDLQGYIVEKISGKTLGAFMRDNIFTPLGMKDTGFHVDPAKASRLASLYSMNQQGALAPYGAGNLAIDYTKEPGMPSGGGGLLSTTTDYLRFAQMLLQGGQLDGVRILAPSSVALMRTNRLPASIRDSNEFGIGFFHVSPGFGFGYDFGVFDNPGVIGRTVGKGSYTWEGAAGTWFWVDPTNDLVFIGMVQRMMDGRNPDMSTLTQAAVYQALLNPEK